MMTFFGMYRNMDNMDKIDEIMTRPEFQSSVRLKEQDADRRKGLKEIFDMGEKEIYKAVKDAFDL